MRQPLCWLIPARLVFFAGSWTTLELSKSPRSAHSVEETSYTMNISMGPGLGVGTNRPLDPALLPVAGIEMAKKLLDESLPSNTLDKTVVGERALQ